MASAAQKPVYVLLGTDQFLLDAARKEVVAGNIGPADPQTCVSVFDATAEAAEVLDELRTLPFLAERRVVIVRDADAFVAAHREKIEKYVESPTATAALVLMLSSCPKNTRLYKAVAKAGEIIQCSADDKSRPVGFVREAANRRGKRIGSQAADLLIAAKGTDLAALDSEMEKLALYVGERDEVTPDDVSRLVVNTAGPAAFALTNAMTDGSPKAALEALGGMLTQRGEEFRALGLIAWHMRKVLKAKQLMAAGRPPQAACKQAGVYYGQREFAAMVQKRPLAKIEQDFRRMLRADLAMKTGADPTAALQELVVGLCS